jgi:hypothetical protein
MADMKCPEKEELEEKCTARWNDYMAVINESKLSIDPGSGIVNPPSISELVAMRGYAAGSDPAKSPYSVAVRIRGEHLRASLELSNHLSRHRC